MNVHDIDHATPAEFEIGVAAWVMKQRRLEIGADQIAPGCLIDGAERCRKEARGIVDQSVQPTVGRYRSRDEPLAGVAREQICLTMLGRARSQRIERRRELCRLVARTAEMHHHAGARRASGVRSLLPAGERLRSPAPPPPDSESIDIAHTTISGATAAAGNGYREVADLEPATDGEAVNPALNSQARPAPW